jgi:putative peptide zinc metalloprotease protein
MTPQTESIAVSQPKLRADLILRAQAEGEAEIWVVKDPVSERYFRFRSVEGFILAQLDGATALDVIRERVEAEFGGALTVATLEQFVARLQRLGLLAGGDVVAKPARHVRGSLLYLRLRAVNPDRLLTFLAARTSFLFTKGFVVLSATAILAGLGIMMANWNEIERELPRLFSLHSVALAWVVSVLVICAHEFAHGLTCKHFGGHVREMGFLLIFFQPAFYCNVSDAWLFRHKASRLWVTFAGAYFEMFLWALAMLVWRITDPNTLINFVAFVIVATSAVKSFFNLNPLIKLDGYYLLSDYLEIPNLRQRAFAYIRAFAGRLTGGDAPLPAVTARERKIFFFYGALAWIYSTWLLTWVGFYFGGLLVNHYQGWGFVSFALCFVVFFRHPLRKVLRAPGRLVTVRSHMRGRLKWIVRLSIIALLAAVLIFCRAELKISGEFSLLPLRNADVRAEIEGTIQSIDADENDRVQQGDRIASLIDRDVRAELRKTKAQVDESQAKLRLLKAGPRPEEVELLRTGVAKADERVKYARGQLDRDESLLKDKLIPQKQFEDTQELLFVREKELQEARDRLKLLLAGSRPEEIEVIEAELSRLLAQQRHLQEQLELLTIRSPITGVVTTHKLKEKIGRTVEKGDLVAVIHEMNTVTAEIAVPEKEIGEVKPGQKVVLKVRAYPERSFEGTVASIAPVATAPEDVRADRTILVMTQLENSSRLLKPEMTGHAKIYAGERRLWRIVTRRVVRYVRVEFWSWW